ncbi:MAG: monovalent cation/H+ antiporter subunit D family protein [Candidatus Omnitrophica bacterium]|nr:monovalent cation/H+ antiporter subunit D family protein [Candidatus Omnitrophota bacterium]
MTIGANIIPLFVAVPLAGAFLISLFGKKRKWLPDVLGVLPCLILSCLSLISLYIFNQQGALSYSMGGWKAPVGIEMVLDGLTAFMLVTVNVVAFCIALYSIDYMKKFTAKWKFYTLFLLMLGGMNGVIITGDLFNLFVFLEIAAVASYALVAFGTERHELEAAFKYAIMGTVGSLFVLLAIAFLYSYTSTLNMADMAAVLTQKGMEGLAVMVSVMFIMGFGLKAAVVPFHAWLADAHPSAPAPISAMLSGVLIKTLGVYALCRIFYTVIGVDPKISSALLFLGTLSMVVGGLLALGQWDLKRLMAYSSISQIGYIILGISLGTPLGILGGLFHLFNHSVFKSLLFLNSGAIEYATGTRDLQKMGGLAKAMPTTATTGMTGAMSIAGIPPFSGFWSKLLIIMAAVQAEKYSYAFWAVLVSILTLGMYLKAVRYAFFGNLKASIRKINRVPVFMKLSMIILALICLLGGVLLLPGVQSVFLEPAQQVLLKGIR